MTIVDVAGGGKLVDIRLGAIKASGVAFSPEGNRLAIPVLTDREGRPAVLILDSFSGSKLVETPPSGALFHTCVAFSPHGDRMMASADKQALVWDAGTGELLLRVSHAGNVHHVAFSPDGAMIATASADGTLQIWNI